MVAFYVPATRVSKILTRTFSKMSDQSAAAPRPPPDIHYFIIDIIPKMEFLRHYFNSSEQQETSLFKKTLYKILLNFHAYMKEAKRGKAILR